jgi:hypothetical protein
MQLLYGTYQFAVNAVDLGVEVETLFNAGGQPYMQRDVVNVTGLLQGTSQNDMAQQMNALMTALNNQFQDLVFKLDDGTNSAAVLLNSTSTSGVRIRDLQFPSEPGTGAGYATVKRFSFRAEAEYPLPGSANFLVSWQESLSFSGGGPLVIHLPAVNGVPPQKQISYPMTAYRATQSGNAVGYRQRPFSAPPIWPDALKQSPDVTLVSPRLNGRIFQDYGISWNYLYESATPLVGFPTLWPGVNAQGPV